MSASGRAFLLILAKKARDGRRTIRSNAADRLRQEPQILVNLLLSAVLEIEVPGTRIQRTASATTYRQQVVAHPLHQMSEDAVQPGPAHFAPTEPLNERSVGAQACKHEFPFRRNDFVRLCNQVQSREKAPHTVLSHNEEGLLQWLRRALPTAEHQRLAHSRYTVLDDSTSKQQYVLLDIHEIVGIRGQSVFQRVQNRGGPTGVVPGVHGRMPGIVTEVKRAIVRVRDRVFDGRSTINQEYRLGRCPRIHHRGPQMVEFRSANDITAPVWPPCDPLVSVRAPPAATDHVVVSIHRSPDLKPAGHVEAA